jgi:long-subunit acyl-CoA synthetase (AMP-forming)
MIADAAGVGEFIQPQKKYLAGYWQNTTRTQATFTADGWMRTEDLASTKSR